MAELAPTIGFIGLGVMGGPMAKNVVAKHPGVVHVFDLSAAALEELRSAGAQVAGSVAALAAACDIVLLSLPGGAQVEQVCLGDDGLASAARPGLIVIDLSTTGVEDARRVAARLAERGIRFADAPVARAKAAAIAGTLSITVGADEGLFAAIAPLLGYMGSDVTLCGAVGCGQVVKLVNNTLLFEHVAALAEMMIVAERAGVPRETLAGALSLGSADSFALRNHGMKAMVPGQFPEKAFPSPYVLKDLGYAIALAESMGVEPRLPRLVAGYYEAAVAQGIGEKYFPAIIDVVDRAERP